MVGGGSPAGESWSKKERRSLAGTTGISNPCRNLSTCRELRRRWYRIPPAAPHCRQIRRKRLQLPLYSPPATGLLFRDSPAIYNTMDASPSPAFRSINASIHQSNIHSIRCRNTPKQTNKKESLLQYSYSMHNIINK